MRDVGHSPFHYHHPPIYNIKRSTIKVMYRIDRGRSVRVRSIYGLVPVFTVSLEHLGWG